MTFSYSLSNFPEVADIVANPRQDKFIGDGVIQNGLLSQNIHRTKSVLFKNSYLSFIKILGDGGLNTTKAGTHVPKEI